MASVSQTSAPLPISSPPGFTAERRGSASMCRECEAMPVSPGHTKCPSCYAAGKPMCTQCQQRPTNPGYSLCQPCFTATKNNGNPSIPSARGPWKQQQQRKPPQQRQQQQGLNQPWNPHVSLPRRLQPPSQYLPPSLGVFTVPTGHALPPGVYLWPQCSPAAVSQRIPSPMPGIGTDWPSSPPACGYPPFPTQFPFPMATQPPPPPSYLCPVQPSFQRASSPPTLAQTQRQCDSPSSDGSCGLSPCFSVTGSQTDPMYQYSHSFPSPPSMSPTLVSEPLGTPCTVCKRAQACTGVGCCADCYENGSPTEGLDTLDCALAWDLQFLEIGALCCTCGARAPNPGYSQCQGCYLNAKDQPPKAFQVTNSNAASIAINSPSGIWSPTPADITSPWDN